MDLSHFTTLSKEIHRSIVECNSKEDVSTIRARIVELNKLPMELPSYEQKRVISVVNSLYDMLDTREAQLGTTKFSFSGPPINSNKMVKIVKSHVEDGPQIHSSAKEFVGLHDDVFELLETTERHVFFRDLENMSIIVTPPGQGISSICVQGALRSVFKLQSDGPIFIHDMKECVVRLDCHQARLHNMHQCIIVIDRVSNSRIIIEDCDDLVVVAQDEINVDDFSWPTKLRENPHYRLTKGSPEIFAEIEKGKVSAKLQSEMR